MVGRSLYRVIRLSRSSKALTSTSQMISTETTGQSNIGRIAYSGFHFLSAFLIVFFASRRSTRVANTYWNSDLRISYSALFRTASKLQKDIQAPLLFHRFARFVTWPLI
jgi:hypothetical protein